MKPRIALVQGDATGIGPELMAKLLSDDEVLAQAEILVLSDRRVFAAGCAVAGREIALPVVARAAEADFSDGRPNLLDLGNLDPAEVTPGRACKAAGAAALDGYGRGLDLARDGAVGAVCFLPFNKDALHRAGLGHDDELQWAKAHLGCETAVGEFNVIDGLWNARVTSHVPLSAVAGLITEERVLSAVELADRTLRRAGLTRPRIAVAALNPHAGDGGNIGREEIEIIAPAVTRAREKQLAVEGPFPSDTLYLKLRDGLYDCAVSMYHDQGQIAIKLLGFDRGVTVLAGLPVAVTTPAHGTAFDIVGRGIAKVDAAKRAVMMAAEMAETRR